MSRGPPSSDFQSEALGSLDFILCTHTCMPIMDENLTHTHSHIRWVCVIADHAVADVFFVSASSAHAYAYADMYMRIYPHNNGAV